MAKEMKRRSLSSKILAVVMKSTLASMLAITLVTEFCFIMTLRANKIQIIEKLNSDMLEIVSNKAELAYIELENWESGMDECAAFIHELYTHPDHYATRDVSWINSSNAGKYVMQKMLRDESVNEGRLITEERLLANAEDFFAAMIETDDTICSLYLATESGLMLRYDNESPLEDGIRYYDYHADSFYTAAKESGESVFTEVVEDSRGRGLIVTCASPFYDEKGEFAGVVAMDIFISDLFGDLVTVNMDDTIAMFVDGQGNMICAAEKDAILTDYEPDTSALKTMISNDKADIYEAGSDLVFYAFAPVGEAGWSYCLCIGEHEMRRLLYLMEAVSIIMNIVFVVMDIIIVLVIISTVRRFSKRLTDPLVELGRDAQRISTGDFEHHAIVHDNDEIGDLAQDFNRMADALKRYIADIKQVTAEKERIGAELNVATQIQADMLPRIFPAFPDRHDFDIYATMDPAKEVGGDFYDFFLIDDTHLAMVMADVSGKGVPAALFMVIAKTLIKNRAQIGNASPAKILGDVNTQLCEGNDAELFVTVWLAIVDLETGKGVAANAGHEHPAVRRKDGSFELVKTRHSPAVATMEGIRFREHDFELFPGDTLFVYTDGVPEATNAENELYGTDRMLEVLNQCSDKDLKEMLHAVRSGIDVFVGDAPQFDDITMLGMTYFGKEQ